MAAAVPAVAGVLGFHQHPVWRILRLTPHSGDDGRPLLLGTTRESGRPAPRRNGSRLGRGNELRPTSCARRNIRVFTVASAMPTISATSVTDLPWK